MPCLGSLVCRSIIAIASGKDAKHCLRREGEGKHKLWQGSSFLVSRGANAPGAEETGWNFAELNSGTTEDITKIMILNSTCLSSTSVTDYRCCCCEGPNNLSDVEEASLWRSSYLDRKFYHSRDFAAIYGNAARKNLGLSSVMTKAPLVIPRNS